MDKIPAKDVVSRGPIPTADEGCDSDKNNFIKFFSNFDFQFFNSVNFEGYVLRI